MNGVSVSVSASPTPLCPLRTKLHASRHTSASCSVILCPLQSSNFKLQIIGNSKANGSQRIRIRCNSSSSTGGPGSGDNESRSVLDAFFLGKAFADALTERLESGIGEILSGIGRLQAEQQKQVQEFQEEVIERAKRAKDKAAREAMEAQGLTSKSTTGFSTPRADSVSSPAITEDDADNGQPSMIEIADPDSSNRDDAVLDS